MPKAYCFFECVTARGINRFEQSSNLEYLFFGYVYDRIIFVNRLLRLDNLPKNAYL